MASPLPLGVGAGASMRPSDEQKMGDRVANATVTQGQQITQPYLNSWTGAINNLQGNANDYLQRALAGDTVAQAQLAQGQAMAQQGMAAQAAGHGPAAGRAAALAGGNLAGQGLATSAALKAQEMQNAYGGAINSGLAAGQQYGAQGQLAQNIQQNAQNWALQNEQIRQGQAAADFNQGMTTGSAIAGSLGGAFAQGVSGGNKPPPTSSDERIKVLADRLWRR